MKKIILLILLSALLIFACFIVFKYIETKKYSKLLPEIPDFKIDKKYFNENINKEKEFKAHYFPIEKSDIFQTVIAVGKIKKQNDFNNLLEFLKKMARTMNYDLGYSTFENYKINNTDIYSAYTNNFRVHKILFQYNQVYYDIFIETKISGEIDKEKLKKIGDTITNLVIK